MGNRIEMALKMNIHFAENAIKDLPEDAVEDRKEWERDLAKWRLLASMSDDDFRAVMDSCALNDALYGYVRMAVDYAGMGAKVWRELEYALGCCLDQYNAKDAEKYFRTGRH